MTAAERLARLEEEYRKHFPEMLPLVQTYQRVVAVQEEQSRQPHPGKVVSLKEHRRKRRESDR